MEHDKRVSPGLGAPGEDVLERWGRQVGDRDSDPRGGFRLMSAPADDLALDSLHRHGVEPDVEQESVGVDDLDRLAGPRTQRPGQVAGLAALDHPSPALALAAETRPRL